MPLTLVLGPANAAKAGEVLGSYVGAARRGAALIVPTAADAEHYTRELAGEGVLLGRVGTFAGLAEAIAGRAGYRAAKLSGAQRERLLALALERAPLGEMGALARTPGFLAAAGELVAELQRCLITPQRLARALELWTAEDPGRAAHAAAVTGIYRAYARELERIGRVDAELFAWRALDALRANPACWGQTPVYFYGFDDLLAIERDAIETLARVAGAPVVVSLTYEPGRSALEARAGVVEELRQLADEVLELPGLDLHYEPGSRAALHHLERCLFQPGSGRVAPAQSVALLEAGGERAEAELVAAELLDRLAAGVAAEEIVVVCRSLRRVAPALELVLSRYGVPVSIQRELPLVHTTLGASLLSLARCALRDGSASAGDLLRYLRSPGRVERVELLDALERSVRRGGLRSAEEASAALGWRLGELEALRRAPDAGAELLAQARSLFAAPHRGRGEALDEGARLDARALRRLEEVIGELAQIGERPALDQLPALLEGLSVPSGSAPRPGAVLVAEPLQIRARRFRVVVIYGLCDGQFPAARRGDPFLSEEQRLELARCSGLRLGLGEDPLAAERYLFYSAVSRASERLVLSYRSSDEEGNVTLPSPFVADVAELLEPGFVSERRRRLLADLVWPLAQAPTERERARARAAAEGRATAAEDRATAAEDRATAAEGGAAAEGRATAVVGCAQPGEIVLSPAALAHVRHREVVSGGALECFADCPVRWLVERQLSLDTLDPDPDPLSRGSWMHGVLERLLSELGGPITASSLPRARALLEAILAAGGEPPVGVGRTPRIREGMRLGIEADLRRYLEQEAAGGCDFDPRGLELRFGFEEEGSLPAVELGSGERRARLRGVIDRVDVDPAGERAIVRDYKSGSARHEHQGARWLSERRLQVALYMLAVRRLLALDPVAGFYQPLGGRDLRPRGLFLKQAAVGGQVVGTDAREPAELEQQLAGAEELAVELAERLRCGRLLPAPQTCSREGCRYPGICRSV
jgi:ATP-dependent helicase/DNAse subunit B